MTTLTSTAFFDRARADMNRLRAQAQDFQRQVATGERLASSSDDPVAAVQLRSLDRLQKLAGAAGSLSGQLESDMKAADSALSSAGNVLSRLRELAMQGSSDTASVQGRKAIGLEVEAMRDALIALANSKDTGGNAMFGGAGAEIAYSQDDAGTVTYVGTADAGEVDLGDGFKMTRGLTGPEVFAFDDGGAPGDVFAMLSELATALKTNAPDAGELSREGADKLGLVFDTLTNGRALLGARMGSLDMLGDRSGSAQSGMADRAAALGAVDLTTAITGMQQAMTALEASQASFVRLSSLNLFSLLR